MAELLVRVETYSGYKADERPMRLHLGSDRIYEIAAVEDRWYEPGATYFRVLVEDGDRYVLRHDEAQDVWTLVGYRAAADGFIPRKRAYQLAATAETSTPNLHRAKIAHKNCECKDGDSGS